jgi:ribonucleoside-diphosphate reductase alpha chain
VEVNKEWSARLGIRQAAAVTCVKPSGTVSQLVDSASGIHPRFAPYYIRRVRCDKLDPMARYMQEAGFPCEEDITNPNVLVFAFPQKAPKGAKTVAQMGAMEQLEVWEKFQTHWCEHKPSITVYYTDDEFLSVAAWVWKHFDDMSGISLLPKDDHTYQQAPYEEVSKEEYARLAKGLPEFDWSAMAQYESTDNTIGSQELACTGGACEIP